MSTRLSSDPNLAGLKVTLTIHNATGLIAKDRNMFGKKTSSDPYVKVFYNSESKPIGKTSVKKKTLNPEWEHQIKHILGINDGEKVRHALPTASQMGNVPTLQLVLQDSDKLGNDDNLGQVFVPIILGGMDHQKFQVTTGAPNSKFFCKKAKGEIYISYTVTTLLLPDIVTGNVLPLKMAKNHSKLKVGLGWQVTQRQTPVDLDVSIVAIDTDGKVDMKESVYCKSWCLSLLSSFLIVLTRLTLTLLSYY